jgi:hypothetical protein
MSVEWRRVFRSAQSWRGWPQRFPCEVLWKTGAGSFPNVYLSGTLYHATSLGELIGGLPDLGVVCTVDFFPNAATCQLGSFDFVPGVVFEANSADSGLIRRRIWFMNYGPSIGKTHFTVLCWKMRGYRYHLLKGTVLASTQKHPESQHTPYPLMCIFQRRFLLQYNNITFINESAISFLHFSMISWFECTFFLLFSELRFRNSCQVRESPFCKGDDTMEDEPEAGLIPLRGEKNERYKRTEVYQLGSWDIMSYW